MASVNVEITGDARKLEQTFDKINQGQKKVETGFDNVANAGKESARQVEAANEAAANKGAASYNRILTELKRQGPEGRAQAKKIEEYLQAAGKGGRKSISEITDELKEIDPEAAKAATAADNSFAKFGASAAANIHSIAAGFISVQSAVGTVNEFLKTQEALIDSALTKQLDLATAQQEAAKNLAAFTAVERDELLLKAVPEIALDTGFADVGKLTLALGTAASKGATPEQARAAVTAAARVERLTPDYVDKTAAGSVAVMQNTGLQDPRQAIALLQTTGTQAAITEAAMLIENIPKALGAVSTVRQQDPEEAARQVAALYAQGTRGGNDSQGTSTATFTLDFTSRMAKLFGDLETERVNARSKLESIEAKISKGEFTQQKERDERDRLTKFLGETKGSFDPKQIAMTDAQAKAYRDYESQRVNAQDRIARVDEKIARGTATDKDKFDRSTAQAFLADTTSFWAKQRAAAQHKVEQLEQNLSTSGTFEKERVERERLKSFLAEAQGLEDPGTIFGRIEALQQNPAVAKQFIGEGFGEKQFQVFLTEVLNPLSAAAKGLKESFEVIKADTNFFEQQAADQAGMTPQLRIANARAAVNAAINAQEAFDDEHGTLGEVRGITADVLKNTNPGGFTGFMSWFQDSGVQRGALAGSSAAEESVSAIEYFSRARSRLSPDAVELKQIDAAIEQITGLIAGQASHLSVESVEAAASRARQGVLSPSQIDAAALSGANRETTVARSDALERVANLLEQQLAEMREAKAAQKETATNTRPRPQQPDPAETIRASAASADARAPR